MAKAAVKLKDIAEAAKLSVSATSMALSGSSEIAEATRRRVLALSKQMGYQPRGRRAGSSEKPLRLRIGYLLLGRRFDHGAYGLTLHTHTHLARGRGHRLEALDLPDLDDHQAVRTAIQQFAEDIDGLVVSGLIEERTLAVLRQTGAPLVLLGDVLHEQGLDEPVDYDRVVPDGIAMGRFATRALLRAGCRHVAFLVDAMYPGQSMQLWRDGYRLGLLEAGLAHDPSLERVMPIDEMASDLLARPDKPDAYVIPDLRVARDLLPILAEGGMTLPADRVVLSGPDSLTPRYHFEDYPLVYTPNDLPSLMAIGQLEARYRDRDRPGGRLNLPFTEKNFRRAGLAG